MRRAAAIDEAGGLDVFADPFRTTGLRGTVGPRSTEENLMKRVAAKARTKSSSTKAARASSRAPAKPGKVQRAPLEMDPAFKPVAAAFAKDPDVGLGRMFSSNSVLNVNGKIFAMFVRGQFVAKLPKARVAELVGTGAGVFFDPGHGRLMKEWVAIADTSVPWVALAREAHSFVKAGAR
jgi:hypothetical protein